VLAGGRMNWQMLPQLLQNWQRLLPTGIGCPCCMLLLLHAWR
jgi:hypothetical protein